MAKQQIFGSYFVPRNGVPQITISLLVSLVSADTIFFATISAGYISIGHEVPIPWDTALINPGGHFNTSDGTYMAPKDGYYQ